MGPWKLAFFPPVWWCESCFLFADSRDFSDSQRQPYYVPRDAYDVLCMIDNAALYVTSSGFF